MDISVSMIAGNTADTLDVFFTWATEHFDEINVVVQPDNYDNTLELCQSYDERFESIKLMVSEFDNFSAQFQRSIDMSTKDWTIQLGADEILAEFPYERLPQMLTRMKKKVAILPRFNLQRDYKHYNEEGYPDFQWRVMNRAAGIGMNGKTVDESLNADPKDCMVLEACPIIHFGHIRPHEALIQKGKDRIKFADDDACDGPPLKEHGIEWFDKRNESWDRVAKTLPHEYVRHIEKYLPSNSVLRGDHG